MFDSDDDVEKIIEIPFLLPERASRGKRDGGSGRRRPIVFEAPIINSDFRGVGASGYSSSSFSF